MSVLTQSERGAVSTCLMSIGNANLALLLTDVFNEPSDWISSTPAALVAANIGGRMLNSRDNTMEVCGWLVEHCPGNAGIAAIATIKHRLQTQIDQGTADPINEIWIGAEPMVNRTELRALLRDIAAGHHHGVIYVAGPEMSGRSHSWHLIRHVARQAGIATSLIDFTHETEARTIGHIYTELKRAYAIDAIDDPIPEGATPGDVATKFAARLRRRLATAAAVMPSPWIVIDFTDEVADPAVPEFIRQFCADRDRNAFDNCVIFVLGPLTHLETMRDLTMMAVEELGPVSELEILAAARVANDRGRQRIEAAALNARVEDIFRGLAAMPEDARFPAVRRALIELRKEVRAP